MSSALRPQASLFGRIGIFDILGKQPDPPKSIYFVVQDNLFTKDVVTSASKS
jgi:hypothetical protein